MNINDMDICNVCSREVTDNEFENNEVNWHQSHHWEGDSMSIYEENIYTHKECVKSLENRTEDAIKLCLELLNNAYDGIKEHEVFLATTNSIVASIKILEATLKSLENSENY